MLHLRIFRNWEIFNAVFNSEQEKECFNRVRMGSKNLSLAITVCHHLASLMMPNRDPRDIFFYPTGFLYSGAYGNFHILHLFSYHLAQMSIITRHFVTNINQTVCPACYGYSRSGVCDYSIS